MHRYAWLLSGGIVAMFCLFVLVCASQGISGSLNQSLLGFHETEGGGSF